MHVILISSVSVREPRSPHGGDQAMIVTCDYRVIVPIPGAGGLTADATLSKQPEMKLVTIASALNWDTW
jgi:hypothetical protein